MSKTIKIRRGLDVNLLGEADKVITEAKRSQVYAINPADFHNMTPKMVVKVGDKVKAGSVLFKDKYNMDINYVSSVAGTVKDIVRGEKRRILSVLVEADASDEYENIDISNVNNLDAEGTKSFLMSNGLWPFIKMRPLDVVARPNDVPRAIFISGFDSNPLAPDYDFTLHSKDKEIQAGIDLLNKLTSGGVHLTLKNGNPDPALKNAKNCQIHTISGPHPAGNVGVQIHHIAPINKGEIVWTVNAQDVAIIGATALTGKYVPTRLIALTGESAKNRKHYRTLIGASVGSIVEGNIEGENARVISGNVLTGEKVTMDDYIGFYHSQITVIPEGNQYKFFLSNGWLSLGFGRFSISHAYPSWINKSKKFNVDTNLNGEERAFVVTEEYERVFPFDIMPVQLVKAAITNDIDNMEKLGIYEVAPEDFALCELICTSKIQSQEHIRKGLDLIQKECM